MICWFKRWPSWLENKMSLSNKELENVATFSSSFCVILEVTFLCLQKNQFQNQRQSERSEEPLLVLRIFQQQIVFLCCCIDVLQLRLLCWLPQRCLSLCIFQLC